MDRRNHLSSGALSLATILLVGFALHNATEGFGIAGPLTGAPRPSWAFLGLVWLIGGGPTFLGTVLGRSVQSEPIFVLCLAFAAGRSSTSSANYCMSVGVSNCVSLRRGVSFLAFWPTMEPISSSPGAARNNGDRAPVHDDHGCGSRTMKVVPAPIVL
jgi:hypothetical protein